MRTSKIQNSRQGPKNGQQGLESGASPDLTKKRRKKLYLVATYVVAQNKLKLRWAKITLNGNHVGSSWMVSNELVTNIY